MEDVSVRLRPEEAARRGMTEAVHTSVEETTLRTRHSARLAFMGMTRWHSSEYPANLLGLPIPTKRRTLMKTRPRDLQKDCFVTNLVKKRPSKEGKRSAEAVAEVTVDTQEEHEVAEALYCLANIKVNDALAERLSASESEGLQQQHSKTTPPIKRRSHPKTRRTSGLTRRRTIQTRKMTLDDGSLSSGSYERSMKTRRSGSGRTTHSPFRTVFREGGRRVYHPLHRTTPSEPIRRHVIHQQPSRVRSKPQPVRLETSVPERVMLNGQQSMMMQEERGTVSEERYLPVAVWDALKGVYGPELVCTNHVDPKPDRPRTPVKSTEPPPHLHSIQVTSSTMAKRSTDVSEQLKCEERSNESDDGTPLALPQRNNARHIYAAHLIQSHQEKCKEEVVSFPSAALTFGQSRIEDVVKNLPPPPVQEEPSGLHHPFYPSLPMPSTFSTFSTFSMSLPSLPQSLIQSLQNTASQVAPLQPRFPSFPAQSPPGAPPPLVRVSEPWENNR